MFHLHHHRRALLPSDFVLHLPVLIHMVDFIEHHRVLVQHPSFSICYCLLNVVGGHILGGSIVELSHHKEPVLVQAIYHSQDTR